MEKLPGSLEAAVACSRKSEFVKAILGESLLNKFLDSKQAEADEFEKAKNKTEFYNNKYFAVL